MVKEELEEGDMREKRETGGEGAGDNGEEAYSRTNEKHMRVHEEYGTKQG